MVPSNDPSIILRNATHPQTTQQRSVFATPAIPSTQNQNLFVPRVFQSQGQQYQQMQIPYLQQAQAQQSWIQHTQMQHDTMIQVLQAQGVYASNTQHMNAYRTAALLKQQQQQQHQQTSMSLLRASPTATQLQQQATNIQAQHTLQQRRIEPNMLQPSPAQLQPMNTNTNMIPSPPSQLQQTKMQVPGQPVKQQTSANINTPRRSTSSSQLQRANSTGSHASPSRQQQILALQAMQQQANNNILQLSPSQRQRLLALRVMQQQQMNNNIPRPMTASSQTQRSNSIGSQTSPSRQQQIVALQSMQQQQSNNNALRAMTPSAQLQRINSNGSQMSPSRQQQIIALHTIQQRVNNGQQVSKQQMNVLRAYKQQQLTMKLALAQLSPSQKQKLLALQVMQQQQGPAVKIDQSQNSRQHQQQAAAGKQPLGWANTNMQAHYAARPATLRAPSVAPNPAAMVRSNTTGSAPAPAPDKARPVTSRSAVLKINTTALARSNTTGSARASGQWNRLGRTAAKYRNKRSPQSREEVMPLSREDALARLAAIEAASSSSSRSNQRDTTDTSLPHLERSQSAISMDNRQGQPKPAIMGLPRKPKQTQSEGQGMQKGQIDETNKRKQQQEKNDWSTKTDNATLEMQSEQQRVRYAKAKEELRLKKKKENEKYKERLGPQQTTQSQPQPKVKAKVPSSRSKKNPQSQTQAQASGATTQAQDQSATERPAKKRRIRDESPPNYDKLKYGESLKPLADPVTPEVHALLHPTDPEPELIAGLDMSSLTLQSELLTLSDNIERQNKYTRRVAEDVKDGFLLDKIRKADVLAKRLPSLKDKFAALFEGTWCDGVWALFKKMHDDGVNLEECGFSKEKSDEIRTLVLKLAGEVETALRRDSEEMMQDPLFGLHAYDDIYEAARRQDEFDNLFY